MATLLERHPHENILATTSYGELGLPFSLECCRTSPTLKTSLGVKPIDRNVHMTMMPLIQKKHVSLNQKLAEFRVAHQTSTVQNLTHLIGNLLEGMSHLNKLEIAHCDIKPANLLLTPAGLKIVDFSTAVLANSNQDKCRMRLAWGR